MTPNGPLTATELSDLYAIERLLSDYAVALNGRDWDHYRALFHDDAVIDYTGAGGIRGSVAEVSAWVADAFKAFPISQLYITDKRIELHGLTATCESSFFEIALRRRRRASRSPSSSVEPMWTKSSRVPADGCSKRGPSISAGRTAPSQTNSSKARHPRSHAPHLRLRALGEGDDAAHVVAGQQILAGVVDAFERVSGGDERLEVETPSPVEGGELGDALFGAG